MILDFGEWPLWAGALLIFAARVSDVTLGTLRISFISRGEKVLAPLIGFFEILIWLFAITQIVQNLDNLAYYFAYAAGFATGVHTGLRIEDRIALGARVVRTITSQDIGELASALREAGFGVTNVRGVGAGGDVNLVFSIVKRSDVPQYLSIVGAHQPGAFSSVEEVRSVQAGIFRPRTRRPTGELSLLRTWKSK